MKQETEQKMSGLQQEMASMKQANTEMKKDNAKRRAAIMAMQQGK